MPVPGGGHQTAQAQVERGQRGTEIRWNRCLCVSPFAGRGIAPAQSPGVQHLPRQMAQQVVADLPCRIGFVSGKGMARRPQMEADLVRSAGKRSGLDEGGLFDPVQESKFRYGWLAVDRLLYLSHVVGKWTDRDGQINFADGPFLKLPFKGLAHRFPSCEKQTAARVSVQAVHWPDFRKPLAQNRLSALRPHAGQPGRFVDYDASIVLVENFQLLRRMRGNISDFTRDNLHDIARPRGMVSDPDTLPVDEDATSIEPFFGLLAGDPQPEGEKTIQRQAALGLADDQNVRFAHVAILSAKKGRGEGAPSGSQNIAHEIRVGA